MTLCVDIGNTRIKLALFGDDGAVVDRSAVPTARETEDLPRILSEWVRRADAVAVSCVVPALEYKMRKIADAVPFLSVDDSLQLPFTINYEKGKLGADRIVSAAGALLKMPDRDIVIVDAGTAVTFGVLLRDRIFDGGLICAGPYTAIEALGSRAAKLKAVPFEAVDFTIAHSTDDALRAGFFHGYSALVAGIVSRIETSYARAFECIITGGAGGVISKGLSRPHVFDEELSLEGLFSIYRYRMKK